MHTKHIHRVFLLGADITKGQAPPDEIFLVLPQGPWLSPLAVSRLVDHSRPHPQPRGILRRITLSLVVKRSKHVRGGDWGVRFSGPRQSWL